MTAYLAFFGICLALFAGGIAACVVTIYRSWRAERDRHQELARRERERWAPGTRRFRGVA